ncbi:MAG TPA: hypothetical protein DCY13_03570 [Verrucomicrobiales bacterium]|nr:hypothetical protein [Verrucomicrobiales bacterium]
METLLVLLQALVATSIFFVWVVRYDNIVREFREYGLSPALRDFVGILKLFFALLLIVGIWQPQYTLIGALGIAILMACAVFTHLRVKNPAFKLAPSLGLMIIALALVAANWPAGESAGGSSLTMN